MNSPWPRSAVPCVLLLLLLAGGGCMRSEPLAPGAMDSLYRPSGDRWAGAEKPRIEVAGRPLPTRFVMRREDSLFRSAVNLGEARGRLFAGSGDFEVLLADDLGEMLVRVLRDLAERTEGWAERSSEYPLDRGREQWASDTAAILSLLYRLDRGPAAADPREALLEDRSAAASVAPIIQSLTGYLMRRMEVAGGEAELLGRLGSSRSLPVAFILRGAFRLAGLREPAGASREVLEVFDEGPPTAVGVENVLRRRLLAWRDEAEKSPGPSLNRKVTKYLRAVPMILDAAARLAEQWHKFYLVSAALGEDASGNHVVSMVVDVRPGEAVRMDAVHPMAPVLTVEGRARVNFWSTEGAMGEAEETCVRFLDERGGRVAIRFESWVYGLASLFTFPIEDWALEEITVQQTRPERHRYETFVRVLMRSRRYAEGEDRRRALRVHTVRTLEVTTEGEQVERVVCKDTRFEYARPKRRWYYERESREALPKP